VTEYLEPKISSFFVKGLRNSQLLRATFASKSLSGTDFGFSPAGVRRMDASNNLNILNLNLFHPDLFRGSITLYNAAAILITRHHP